MLTSKTISKLCVTGPCDWNPPVTSGFPSQRASNGKICQCQDFIIICMFYRTYCSTKCMVTRGHQVIICWCVAAAHLQKMLWYVGYHMIYSNSMHPGASGYHQLIGLWEILMKYQINNIQANYSNWWVRYLLWNCPQAIITGPYCWYFSIGSGNGLVSSSDKALPQPMLTKFLVAMWSNTH